MNDRIAATDDRDDWKSGKHDQSKSAVNVGFSPPSTMRETVIWSKKAKKYVYI
jgi:hypothetical protein